jgi:hypothetical protein
VAYGWICVSQVIAGVVLWIVSLFLAYKLELFENFRDWAAISRVAFYCGQALIPPGLVFNLLPPTHWMMVPVVLYVVLNIAANRALGRKFKNSIVGKG